MGKFLKILFGGALTGIGLIGIIILAVYKPSFWLLVLFGLLFFTGLDIHIGDIVNDEIEELRNEIENLKNEIEDLKKNR